MYKIQKYHYLNTVYLPVYLFIIDCLTISDISSQKTVNFTNQPMFRS